MIKELFYIIGSLLLGNSSIISSRLLMLNGFRNWHILSHQFLLVPNSFKSVKRVRPGITFERKYTQQIFLTNVTYKLKPKTGCVILLLDFLL